MRQTPVGQGFTASGVPVPAREVLKSLNTPEPARRRFAPISAETPIEGKSIFTLYLDLIFYLL